MVRASKEVWYLLRIPFVIFAFLIPISLAWLPFLLNFHTNRTEWLKKYGFNGIEHNPEEVRNNFIIGLSFVGILWLLLFFLFIKDCIYHSAFPDDRVKRTDSEEELQKKGNEHFISNEQNSNNTEPQSK